MAKKKATPAKKMTLAERIKSQSSSKFANKLNESYLIKRASVYHDTGIPILNLGFSGRFKLGLPAGITTIAAPPKHFKSLYGLHAVEAFQKAVPDGVVIFYDSEFGINQEYLDRFDLDFERIVHIPITTVEELRTDMSKQLKALYDGFMETGKIEDNVMVFVDSVGNIPSDKEVDDAENDKSSADMTRAKVLKSFFRIITTKINMLNIPMVVINHTYQTLEMFSKTVVGGGTGVQYASSNILGITKAQETDSQKNLLGYTFTLVPLMSRYVREKSKLPCTVFFDRGIPKYSGMTELAKKFGYIEPCKIGQKGAYKFVLDGEDGGEPQEFKCPNSEIHDSEEFWERIFEHTDFLDVIEENFSVSHSPKEEKVDADALKAEFSKTDEEILAEYEEK
jgi:RecA/RadA recombinase